MCGGRSGEFRRLGYGCLGINHDEVVRIKRFTVDLVSKIQRHSVFPEEPFVLELKLVVGTETAGKLRWTGWKEGFRSHPLESDRRRKTACRNSRTGCRWLVVAVQRATLPLRWRGKRETYCDFPFIGLSARKNAQGTSCLLYTSPSPRDQRGSRMPSSA